jgi:hypothetical protein
MSGPEGGLPFTAAPFSGVCFHQMDGSARHDGRYRMLIHELRVTVAAQENTEVVEPGDDALQLDAVDEKNRKRSLTLSDVVQERVLKVLCAICGHFCFASFFASLRTLDCLVQTKPEVPISRLLLGSSTRVGDESSFKRLQTICGPHRAGNTQISL